MSYRVDHVGGHRAGREHHGTYRGATLAPNGDVSPPISGVRLDGSGGTCASSTPWTVRTTARGWCARWDRCSSFRETWRLYGVDAHNDGVVSPDNIDDAALAAAGYLCWRGKDLGTPRGWITALRAYNNSGIYARAVRDWATAYAAGRPL